MEAAGKNEAGPHLWPAGLGFGVEGRRALGQKSSIPSGPASASKVVLGAHRSPGFRVHGSPGVPQRWALPYMDPSAWSVRPLTEL